MAARRSQRATEPAVVTVRSPLYPELLVLDPRVEFSDGTAEVTADVVEALRAVPAEIGLLLDGEDLDGEDLDSEDAPDPEATGTTVPDDTEETETDTEEETW